MSDVKIDGPIKSGDKWIVSLYAPATQFSFPTEEKANTFISLINPQDEAPPPEPKPDPELKSKWNPGHYVLSWPGVYADTLINQGFMDEPFIKGAQIRYQWSDLEPSESNYNLSLIEKDLTLLGKRNQQLWIQIQHVGFGGREPAPKWLGKYVDVNTAGSMIAMIWTDYVAERYIKLVKAIATRFDSHPNLEGINANESSTGYRDKSTIPYYQGDAAYSDQLVRIAKEVKQAMPRTHYVQFSNWLSYGNDKLHLDMINRVREARCGIGGPDIFIGRDTDFQKVDKTLGNTHVRANAVQSSNFKTGTARQILAKGVDELKCHYIFWLQKKDEGIFEAIKAANGRINTQKPANVG